MMKHWPLVLTLFTVVFCAQKLWTTGPVHYVLALSVGYAVVTFVCVYATLLIIQWVTGRDYGLVTYTGGI